MNTWDELVAAYHEEIVASRAQNARVETRMGALEGKVDGLIETLPEKAAEAAKRLIDARRLKEYEAREERVRAVKMKVTASVLAVVIISALGLAWYAIVPKAHGAPPPTVYAGP